MVGNHPVKYVIGFTSGNLLPLLWTFKLNNSQTLDRYPLRISIHPFIIKHSISINRCLRTSNVDLMTNASPVVV